MKTLHTSDPLRNILTTYDAGIPVGIASYCTANELVIEACLQQALRFQDFVLIEATANQVNQYGGYTNMTPVDFREFVHQIADRISFPHDKIILGGDHLGPLTWQNESEESAMKKAKELVKLYVMAGFKKIHLDTSMKLADDTEDLLTDETIARRGVQLYCACEEAYQELLRSNPSETRPVYIIGSEVPIPGGAQEAEDSVSVTKPESLQHTITTYQKAFKDAGIEDAFQNIIGVVVQPGVEFGDENIMRYDRVAAKELTTLAKNIPGLVLEGHSTDYQPARALKEMVEDGILILKVGPALTFALREGLFALSAMEKYLIPEELRANFVETLEYVMLQDQSNWKKHYHGNEDALFLKRKFSLSDRCRYYLSSPTIKACIQKLFDNIDNTSIPLSMLHQYMPQQYYKVRDGILPLTAHSLVKDCVVSAIEDYNFATHHNYMISSLFYN